LLDVEGKEGGQLASMKTIRAGKEQQKRKEEKRVSIKSSP